MFAKNKKNGSVKFSIKTGSPAKAVLLAGDFNQWKPTAMRKQKDGSFSVTVDLAKGNYEYKFLVDGQWVVDPDNGTWAQITWPCCWQRLPMSRMR